MGEEKAAGARRWLESVIALALDKDTGAAAITSDDDHVKYTFEALSMAGLRLSRISGGRALCYYRVPTPDGDGNWAAGAIAALMDDVGAAAIASVVGHIKISVDFSISYFNPAKTDEEVEVETAVAEHKGKLTMVVVEIRKKGSRELVALGKQWMAMATPKAPVAKL